jgi:hypothetical protein
MDETAPLIGTPDDVMSEHSLRQLYGIDLHRVRVERGEFAEESFIPQFGICRQKRS